MLKLNFNELQKSIKKMEELGISSNVTITISGAVLELEFKDKLGDLIEIKLHDTNYPFRPTLKRSEEL